MKIAIIGCGSWGSAIGNILADLGREVHMYTRNAAQYRRISEKRDNPGYLEDFRFHDSIRFHRSIEEAIEEADGIVLAVPTAAVRECLKEIAKLDSSARIINLAKGLEQGSGLRLSEVAAEVLPENPYIVLSGPSHAEEVAKFKPTTVVVCSAREEDILWAQDLFSHDSLRVYAQDDMIGVEIGGALKNIIALGAGLSDGLGFGDNTKAALMTRGLTEIQRIGIALGANAITFQGLTGVGDLIVTCTSVHSRNWKFGNLIGSGYDAESAMEKVGMVVEGYKTTKAAYDLSRKMGIEMPITEKLYGVLYEGADPEKAVQDLMLRPVKHENEKIYLL
ncbi:glycerol-3-phosphate dehydrogenase (NAD(P)+) [Peptoniphilus ivorii]|uniref:NAD(P)H-dependent glycerol-3-phosphate dehydrogenase n=1 Tax=Aedoeadaptatus ivorii TaxID=54006 RepID=UPI002781A6A1|nr:NAD(P)H-dependent glycerol-3-phosphate dehydrogenase [Peptoniphilus ivorii]MDQ0507726.1 glycerol-3-phosphate dehydrogenase (NAD(P)+) [Peptoniphilus ivorii]